MPRGKATVALLVAVATSSALAVTATPATAAATQPPVSRAAAFSAGDYCLGQCGDVLPPGQNGNATLAEILANKAFGTKPAHSSDQLGKYAALPGGYQSLTNDQLGTFFNDASFGVPADQVESTTSPRSDVTIVRDKATGTPHIFGTTRSGTEFGAGYAAANDRLWLMDVFRHVGRGKLTSFAGGAGGNRALEQSFWTQAPYTEADLQAQIDRIAASGPRGAQAYQDVKDYVAGINQYISRSYNGRYFPGEYVLTGHVDAITNAGSIDPFAPTDLVAIASVIGALFGSGGGGEVQSALVKLAAENKYGVAQGDQVWQAFAEQNDPEAVLTLHDGQKFPYAASPANPTGVAMPDAGSVAPQQLVYDPTGTGATAAANRAAQSQPNAQVSRPESPAPTGGSADLSAAQGIFADGVLPADLLTKKHGMSNALVVSGAHTDSGHPIAVFGPQTGYFAPQLLMLQELQGPGISARGASFAGLSMYVELGRGQDYSWSATSAGQDITDTYAVDLCDPSGAPATKDSTSYLYHGQCLPMERLEQKNSWSPTVADGTGAGSYTLVMFRTKYGLVQSRATVAGKPVAYASLRSSYRHEVDSIIGFQEFNDPGYVKSATDFQHAANDINYTFNWFYVDSRDTAYFNSGNNPVRPASVDSNLPIAAAQQYEWQGWNPDTNTASYTPFAQHPNSINQDYYVSWNNKQAQDFTAAGFGDGSVHRGNLLDTRVKSLVQSGTKVTRAALTKAMAEAALADLRAENVLPKLLRVLDSSPITDPSLAATVQGLRDWQQSGSLRTETQPGSHAYAHADAIRVLDAWWPQLVHAEFQPALGDDLYNSLTGMLGIDEPPSDKGGAEPHKGSSFQHGWWSYVDKDIRAVLGDPVAGGLAQTYCGGGDLAQCRQVLLTSLQQAAAQPAAQVYPADGDCSAGDQWCADTIIQRPLGGITQDKISWQNRPTFQQVVQFAAHRGDNISNLALNRPVSASSYETGWYNSPPGNAVDDNPSSRWASDWSDNQWITVDLGASQQVGRVVLLWESAYGSAYRIELSDNGTTWRTAYETTTGRGGQENIAFPGGSARYVRMTGVHRATRYGYSLYEFEIYAH
ncbi:penicillin acylase family protein [Solihabitans fulvus]|uniref:Penicillin acylase family protein n=1 Tax=Solihabitans fulvus TaxID=1892852 RepID=A0A5B2WQ63_9PSEU|nr:penicillin acylase family protein [Solihabitans fulvus]KAA2252147.1 penicillin acylase family protein [Solihabitans fulvus]